MLQAARRARATDIHLCPQQSSLEMKWRVDGVLRPVAQFGIDLSPRIVSRLKVLAGLLTYRLDVPQEGRIRGDRHGLHTVQQSVVRSADQESR